MHNCEIDQLQLTTSIPSPQSEMQPDKVVPRNPPNMANYLSELQLDRTKLQIIPNLSAHVERLLDTEIARVRASIVVNAYGKYDLSLPSPVGHTVTLTEKIYVPVSKDPNSKVMGRVLGIHGSTARKLEKDIGCKIMIRGRGSMRDQKQEEANRHKPNWEHLKDELHVLVSVADTENRAHLKLKKAVEEVRKLLEVQSFKNDDHLTKTKENDDDDIKMSTSRDPIALSQHNII